MSAINCNFSIFISFYHRLWKNKRVNLPVYRKYTKTPGIFPAKSTVLRLDPEKKLWYI
jgi:hypothetical protein